MLHRKHNMKTYLHAYINIIASPISNIALVSSRKGVKLESVNHGIPLFFENFLFHDVNAQLIRNIFGYKECKDQFRLRSNTGMDPGPRSPNNEFVERGKKS